MNRASCLWMMSPAEMLLRLDFPKQIFLKPVSQSLNLWMWLMTVSLPAMIKRRTTRDTKIPITPADWILGMMIPTMTNIPMITTMNIIRNIMTSMCMKTAMRGEVQTVEADTEADTTMIMNPMMVKMTKMVKKESRLEAQ